MQFGDGASVGGFGGEVDGGEDVAGGSGETAIGDECDLEAVALDGLEGREELVEFRHAGGVGALEANHYDHIAMELSCVEGGLHCLLAVEDADGAFDDVVVGGEGRGFDDGLPEISLEEAEAAVGFEGSAGGAEDGLVAAGGSYFAPGGVACGVEEGFLCVAVEACSRYGLDVVLEEAGVEQFADEKAHASGGVEVVHVGLAVGVDADEHGDDGGEIGEVLPVEADARGGGHGDHVHGVVGGASGGEETDEAVDEDTFVEQLAEGRVVVGE